MATYLQLTQDLARESGTISPAQIVNVASDTGRAAMTAIWVRKAWVNIQNSRRDWGWMHGSFSQALTINQSEYTAAQLGVATRFGDWLIDNGEVAPVSLYDATIGVADEGELEQIDYWEWYERYARGAHDANRPVHWAITPAKNIVVGPKPDKAYVLRGRYMKSPQVLAANGDIPEMPEAYHDLIVMEGQRLMMISDGAYQESAWPAAEFGRLRNELERDYLPEVTL